ncbi:MAG TPA: RNA-directed DNA polymerase, partial [Polyangiaceae bacterium]|nr:RNA-directed DNA polymerase [Polyangiaceae bacterium]
MTEGCSHEVRAWVSVEQVDRAARACMRRKASRRDALAFRLRYGEEVLSLTRRLAHETYRPEPGIVFVTDRPKLREVHAAAFRDRVVHHLLHELLAPRFESGWSSRTFACRKGLGTHAAVRCLERLVHDASRRGGRRAWGLQLDIASFFPSVHKPTLVRLLGSRFSRAERGEPLFGLIRTIVEHDSTRGARRCGRLDWFDRVPLHKRLGSQGPDRGLPIGNLTSQFFAGIYLASLDHFVQRTIGIGSYVRYMDDLVLVDTDPARLGEAHARIEDFLSTRLLLSLRATSRLEPVSEGIDFLGYVVRPTYSLVRNRVFANLRRRSSEIETSLAPTQLGAGQTLEIPG